MLTMIVTLAKSSKSTVEKHVKKPMAKKSSALIWNWVNQEMGVSKLSTASGAYIYIIYVCETSGSIGIMTNASSTLARS